MEAVGLSLGTIARECNAHQIFQGQNICKTDGKVWYLQKAICEILGFNGAKNLDYILLD
jgi:hypothetical protein